MALVFKKEKRKILNPKLLLLALVALIALVALPAFADQSGNEGNGRYKGFQSPKTDSAYHSIYVLDSKTGELKWCQAWFRKNIEPEGSCKIMKVEK